jgi:hypothetical protein
MKSNKIGILELKSDPFVIDVASRLSDLPVEFLSFAEARAPVSTDYRVVIDRMSFDHAYLKEMVKNMSLDGTYVINNPFAASVNSKLVEAKVCQALGIPSPKSIVLPDPALRAESPGVVVEPNWEKVADEIGLPCILKPVYGYGWVDVYEVNTVMELRQRYAAGAGRIWLVQQKVGYSQYYRVFCIDKRDVLFIRWIPRPLGMGEYLHTEAGGAAESRVVEQMMRLHSCLDMDINVVEWCVDGRGQGWVIDALNEVPDMPKERMPPEHYWWIVDRFASCVRNKLRGDGGNRTLFEIPVPQGVSQGDSVQVS